MLDNFYNSFDHWRNNSVKLFITAHKHLNDPRYNFPQGYRITKTGVTKSSYNPSDVKVCYSVSHYI